MARTPGPLLGYFSFCPCYFHAGFTREVSWRLKKSTNTVGCPFVFKLLKVNILFISCAQICVHVAEFVTQCVRARL